jgi:ribonucleoside-triphosphate reductase
MLSGLIALVSLLLLLLHVSNLLALSHNLLILLLVFMLVIPYYIRTVRGDNKDPLTQFMKDQGIPSEPDVFKPDQTTVFSFPIKSPDNAVVTSDVSAIEQLKMWLAYQRNWCEHKPSVTINVKKDEWFEVGAFVYEHFDEMSGVSFLPYNEHTYQQAPYQEVGKSEYEVLIGLLQYELRKSFT